MLFFVNKICSLWLIYPKNYPKPIKMNLTTTRTQLNLLQEEDYAQIIASFQEKDTVKFIKHLQNLTDEEYREFLEKKRLLTQQKENFFWVVREKTTQNLVGTIGLTPYLGSKTAFHIGFRIRNDFQRQGFAYELSKRVIDFVQKELHHTKIYGLAMQENDASIKILQKLGFEFVESEFNTDYQIQLETYQLNF